MIKTVIDPLWLEQQRAFAFAELAAYTGGADVLKEKLRLDQTGVEGSVIDDCCLVRTRRLEHGQRDRDRFRFNCLEESCKMQHQWQVQRGYFDAILLGRFDHLVDDGVQHKVLHLLAGGYDASHLCHNSPCSDPFHFNRETRTCNCKREECRRAAKRGTPIDCPHTPRCRVNLIWRERSWEEVYDICQAVKQEVIRPKWRCSKKCCSESKKDGSDCYAFTSLIHWRNGCKRGGTFIPV